MFSYGNGVSLRTVKILTKVEADTMTWGIAVIGGTMFLFAGMWTLVLYVRKTMDALSMD